MIRRVFPNKTDSDTVDILYFAAGAVATWTVGLSMMKVFLAFPLTPAVVMAGLAVVYYGIARVVDAVARRRAGE